MRRHHHGVKRDRVKVEQPTAHQEEQPLADRPDRALRHRRKQSIGQAHPGSNPLAQAQPRKIVPLKPCPQRRPINPKKQKHRKERTQPLPSEGSV